MRLRPEGRGARCNHEQHNRVAAYKPRLQNHYRRVRGHAGQPGGVRLHGTRQLQPLPLTSFSLHQAEGERARQLVVPQATAMASALAQVSGGSTASQLVCLGLFILGLAVAALAVAAIPAILEMRRTAKEMQLLLRALEREVPDTASALRLTGLELTDAIQEVSSLSSDVTRGLQASARMLQGAEGTVRQGAALVSEVGSTKLLPAIRARVPTIRGVLERRLKANSGLDHTNPTLLQFATATKITARRMRFALAAANLASRARIAGTFLTQTLTILPSRQD